MKIEWMLLNEQEELDAMFDEIFNDEISDDDILEEEDQNDLVKFLIAKAYEREGK